MLSVFKTILSRDLLSRMCKTARFCIVLCVKRVICEVGESGAHSCMGHIRFQQFMGTRVTARAQGKLWKYVYHCRPSFTVEDNTVPAVMLDKNANL